MHDVTLRRMMMDDRIETLRRDARRLPRPERRAVVESADIELRLCKPEDDDALERLAALAEQPVPFGRLVVALVDGQLVAALPLGGGSTLRDPFAKTTHLVRLLQLRADQLRTPAPRRGALRLLGRHA